MPGVVRQFMTGGGHGLKRLNRCAVLARANQRPRLREPSGQVVRVEIEGMPDFVE
jgi:hypothetical protein